MRTRQTAVLFGALGFAAMTTGAHAYELGSPGYLLKPGQVIGAAAATPPPGLYAFEQLFTYQAKLVGPGAPIDVNGSATTVKADAAAHGFVYVPGWTFLGGTYDAVAVLPFVSATAGSPINATPSGVHNVFFANELSWRLGESGFFVKAGLGTFAPTGTVQGANGLGNIGNPWWTFMPDLVVSYLKDGWNLTANVFEEINTANTITNYRSGDVLHAEFTATKSIGKWTVGPVGTMSARLPTIDRARSTAARSTSTASTSGRPVH